MDEDRLTSSLRDEIGRAIEAVLSVPPPPSLAATVRARVDLERARTRSPRWMTWQLAAVTAIAVAVVSTVLVSRLWRPESSVAPSTIAAVSTTVAAPYAGAVRPVSLGSNTSAALPAPASLRLSAAPGLSPDAIALREYVTSLRQRRIAAATLAASPTAIQVLELPAITIERIAIDPLPLLEAVTGERQ